MLTLTGNLEAITGSTSGYVKVTLSGYGQDVPRVSGTGVIIQPTITSALASSFSLSLFGNDVITPANTYYVVSFYDMVGNLLSSGSYTFTGIGTINLSSATPVLTVPNASNVLAKVATTGNYNDLINIPVGGGGGGTQVNSDWNATSGVAQVLNKPNLAAVALSGAYSDLVGAPAGGGTQVNSDWNAVTGVAQILNKPTLATVATTGSYLDLTNLPVTGVSSVAGRSGAVTLVEADIANLVTDLAAKEVITNKGVANGYASLDATGKVPAAQLPASSSSAVWGTITGTIASQTDLQTALGTKAPTASPTFTGVVTASSINSGSYLVNGTALNFSNLAGLVTTAQLPLPTATTVGGVKSLAAVASKFLTSIGTDGSVTSAQPAWTDISGKPTLAVTKAATASNYLTSYDSSTGTFTAAQPTWTDIASKPTTFAPDSTAELVAHKGQINGYCPLDANGFISSIYFRNPPVTKSALASNFLTSFDASSGLFTAAQPTWTDISGKPALATVFSAVSNQFLTSYTASTGAFTAAQPSFSNISGTIVSAQLPSRTASVNYGMDGGGVTPNIGSYGQIYMPTACTITGWVITADVAGSASITINSGAYSAFPTLTLLGTLTLTSAQKATTTGLSWTVNAGDVIQFNLGSASTLTRINITLICSLPWA